MRTPGREHRLWAALILGATLTLCHPLFAQQGNFGFAAEKASGSSDAKQSKASETQVPAKVPLTPEEQKRAQLQADTEKLYRLTQELKAEVAKSNKDTLSVSVIKKAQEIEALAKSIKERSRSR